MAKEKHDRTREKKGKDDLSKRNTPRRTYRGSLALALLHPKEAKG
jgi:hypothetical protein